MLFSFFYIWAVGGSYTLHTNSFFEDEKLPSYRVEIEDESVVRVKDLRMENRELVAEFEAVGKGESEVKLIIIRNGEEYAPQEYKFSVNGFGTLFDITLDLISFNGLDAVIYAILIQLLLTEIIMIWMYIDYRRKGDFSYAMIACGGLSIYIGFLLAFLIYSVINKTILSLTFFIGLVETAGDLLLLLLAPFMLLLSVLLAVSNIWLMRHEGYRPVNSLGIIFAVVWFLGAVLTIGQYFYSAVSELPFYDIIGAPLVYVVAYMECMFIATVACSYLAVKYKTPLDRDYIIILGCAIRKDGTLTPLLKGRVDSAVEFEKKQFKKTGKHAVFVPSGGQGPNEVVSEGEAMENYLLSIGIPDEQILREDKSVNTFENMKFSGKVIEADTDDFENKKIAFATTNYHIFRGYILSKKNGFEAKGIPAKTKQYFFPNAFLREFIGLLVDKKWKHVIFILLTLLFS